MNGGGLKNILGVLALLILVILVFGGIFGLWMFLGWHAPKVMYPDVPAPRSAEQGSGTPRQAPPTTQPDPADVAETQALRGQLGDQFGAVNSLFAAFAFAAVLIGLIAQHLSHRRELYSARLLALIEHFKQFHTPEMFNAREGAWACLRRAIAASTKEDLDYREQLALFSVVSLKLQELQVKGNYLMHKVDFAAQGEAGKTFSLPARSWNRDLHSVEQVISFYTAMVVLIRAAAAAGSRSERRQLRQLVLTMPTYWDWWGPMLRYIVQLRTERATRAGGVKFVAEPEANDAFDTLDRYALRPVDPNDPQAPSTKLGPDGFGLEILRRICATPWTHYDVNAPTVTAGTRFTDVNLQIKEPSDVQNEANADAFREKIGLEPLTPAVANTPPAAPTIARQDLEVDRHK